MAWAKTTQLSLLLILIVFVLFFFKTNKKKLNLYLLLNAAKKGYIAHLSKPKLHLKAFLT